MAEAAGTSSTLPYSSSQQLPGQAMPSTIIPEAVSSTDWRQNSTQSGSIGPFFAVVSVIAVLTIASCVIGRAYSRRLANTDPLDSITRRSCGAWMKDSWSYMRSSRRLGVSFKGAMFRKEQRLGDTVGNDEDILEI